MAVRRFMLNVAQSNGAPSADAASWYTSHAGLDLTPVSRKSVGSYSDKFAMPGNFPGFTTLDMKGVAVASIRYLTFYNPTQTGYRSYPGVCRVAPSGGGVVHTTTNVYFEQQFSDGSHNVASITRKLTGVVHTVTAVDDSPGFATTGSKLTLTPALNPAPIDGEEFTHTFLAESNGSTTTAVLNMGFGLLKDGKLTGLLLTCTSGANVGQGRIISAWDAGTNTATVAAFSNATLAGDAFTITPQSGTFEEFAFLLPWCPYETTLTASKPNPYPPGFDYPNHWHLPEVYSADGQTTTVNGVTLSFRQLMAYHTGLASILSEKFGETIDVLTCDFSGSSLGHNESGIPGEAIGWFDPAQQSYWAPGEGNNCFARLLDELDALAAAYTAQGDTGECIGIWMPQGETDAWISEKWAQNYLTNGRTIRTKIREALVARGLWSKSAEKIPFVQPKISTQQPLYVYRDIVNPAIGQLAESDRYGATLDTGDIPLIDGFHYTGAGQATLFEPRMFAAWLGIANASDQTSEVEICNLALLQIGNKARVTSIDPVDGTAESRLCATFYPLARDAVLESHQWGFALKRRAMTAIASEASSYRYAYARPGDAHKVFAVLPPNAADDYVDAAVQDVFSQSQRPPLDNTGAPVPQPFDEEQQLDGTTVIYTDQADAVVRYVSKVTDTRRFSATFKRAVAHKLAVHLCGALVQGEAGVSLALQQEKLAMVEVAKAKELDDAQRVTRVKHVAPWIRGR